MPSGARQPAAASDVRYRTLLDEAGREVIDLTESSEDEDEDDEEEQEDEEDESDEDEEGSDTGDRMREWLMDRFRDTSPGWYSIHGVDVCERECFVKGEVHWLTAAYIQFVKMYH